MIFQADGKKYRISFHHRVFEGHGKVLDTMRGRKLVRGETTCFLAWLPPSSDAIKIAEGVAHCFVPDQYNKNQGRVRSLRNALRNLWPDRHEMWGAAFKALSGRHTEQKSGTNKEVGRS